MAYQSEREEIEHKKYVDFKDVEYLRLFTDPHSKILPKKRTRVSSERQREIALAMKRARYMALIPYLAA